MSAAAFKMLSLAPVLYAEPIEPCLPFWTEGLGFEVVATVPGDGGKLGFAMLRKDGVEVQYQSRTNLAVDAPGLANMPSSVTLYLEVDSLDAVLDGPSNARSSCRAVVPSMAPTSCRTAGRSGSTCDLRTGPRPHHPSRLRLRCINHAFPP